MSVDLNEARGATPAGEIKARIAKALEQIEAAQNLLSAAAANLSPLIGAMGLWQRAAKLSSNAHALWSALDFASRARAARWKLDGVNMRRFEQPGLEELRTKIAEKAPGAEHAFDSITGRGTR